MFDFMMMKFFYLTIWQLLIMAIGAENIVPRKLDTLTLEIHFPGNVSTIEFLRVHRALANKHLPVWMTTNDPGKDFKKLNIMNQVGRVSFFHDTCSKSSLVFYHKRNEIDGNIGTTYYIKRFRINKQAKVQHVDHSVLRVMDHYTHTFNTESTESINDTLTRSQRSPQQIFYLEMLIVINHKTFRAIEKNSDLPRGVATVSHVLTVNNGADLIYQLLDSPKIQLNIAGIVIEGIPNQWTFESDVITDSENKLQGMSRVYVDSDSIHSKVSNYFWLWQNIFPRHSYDMIQYLTTSFLKDKDGDIILGQAIRPIVLNTYMFPPDFFKDRITTVNRIFESYKHFMTIAHEIAHTFSARHDGHDEYGYLFDADSCGETIMADRAICSESCLKWSRQAYAEFADYFSNQPARCNLLNYPRSLDVPKPKLVHSVAEQCECYGYKPSFEPYGIIFSNECGAPMICTIKYSEDQILVTLPMDGTPCGHTKVCWNKQCVKYNRRSLEGFSKKFWKCDARVI